MPVKFRCTECGRLISVPSKMVGKTINCPHNGCLVQVRAEEIEPTHGHGGNGQHSHADETQNGSSGHTATALETSARPAPAKTGEWLRRNVARFIPGGGGTSGASLVSEGRLPELKLQEGQARRGSGEAEATNPLVMIGVLCLSFVMSTALLLVDFESPGSGSARRTQARKQLAHFYETSQGTLAPYQRHLRDAQRAHARGDTATERQLYRRVLQLLRTEGRSRFSSLTSTPSQDRELEELLAILMSES